MTDAAEISEKTDKAIAACTLASFLLMTVGGGVAWGLGGILFGAGLWVTIALLSDDITKSTGETDR